MSLSQEVRDAAQAVVAATPATLIDALNGFIGRFMVWPFRTAPGFVRDYDGHLTERFAAVVHRVKNGEAPDGDAFAADAVAAVIDACEVFDRDALRAAYTRVAQAKRLRKAAPERVPGVPVTTVTLGIIFALRSGVPLEALAEELDRLNVQTPGSERPDMIVVASTGSIQYAVQFPGEGISGDFLPPGDGALDAYTPPLYIVMVMRATGDFALNRMMAFLIAHLAFFQPGAKLPLWNDMLVGVSQQAVTVTGYQYNQAGELRPVPREFYNDRYLGPRPVRIEQGGQLLATLEYLPWQDGGAILLKGKLPLEPLLIFLGKDALRRAGVIKLREAQLSYVLPITSDDFRRMLGRIQRQSNMVVRPEETNWVVKKIADEGSQSPFIARLMIGLLKLRGTVFSDQPSRERFDKAYDVVLTSLFSARTAMNEVLRVWEQHERRIASGEAARVQGRQMYIDETVDKALGLQTDVFLSAATRGLKQGMQGVAAELQVNVGFLFQKQAPFEAGVAALQASNPQLADYLRQTRQWSEVLVGRRNAVEHEGWRLPDVVYGRADNGVKATQPTVDGRSVSEYVAFMFDRLSWFVEDVTAHCLQNLLPRGITITELPREQRHADVPERFRLTLVNGGLPRWVIATHQSTFEEG